MDKRIKKICVVDTETIGDLKAPEVYDFGFTITDKKGNIYHQENYLIKEIWEQKERMQSAYYACKLPKYYKLIEEEKIQVLPYHEVMARFTKALYDFDVAVIGAYNLAFDKRAMQNTHQILEKPGYWVKKKCEYWDIWGIACQTIFQQKTFHKMALRENWYSEKGNVLTNAEIAYRYISNDLQFIESHTALHDTEIESQILARCVKQHVKLEKGKGIYYHPWQVAQKGRPDLVQNAE